MLPDYPRMQCETRWSTLDEVSERSRMALRAGESGEAEAQGDHSQLLADGRLIRSERMARMEAVLLISRGALTANRLGQLAGLSDASEVAEMISTLNEGYDRGGSAFRIEQTAIGYLMMTRPALVSWLDRLHERQAQLKLSPPMMETLTIVAYQQPVTRAGVESIRGVQSAEMIRQLIDRGLIKVGGEEDSLGRPFLYVTTRQFLDMFGLGRVQDLPDYHAIGRKAKETSEASVEGSLETADTSQAA